MRAKNHPLLNHIGPEMIHIMSLILLIRTSQIPCLEVGGLEMAGKPPLFRNKSTSWKGSLDLWSPVSAPCNRTAPRVLELFQFNLKCSFPNISQALKDKWPIEFKF